MSDLKLGFYKATVCGVPDVLLVVGEESDARSGGWTVVSVGGCYWHQLNDITDARRLIVLDMTPDALNFISTLVLGGSEHSWSKEARRQIEAQTKPPRIPEPGLWGVVTDSGGAQFVRTSTSVKRQWTDAATGNRVAWEEIDADPVLTREGVA